MAREASLSFADSSGRVTIEKTPVWLEGHVHMCSPQGASLTEGLLQGDSRI